ncbi:MAG: ABC transporter ATP-binding protein [Candidatus Hodarchaeales archaeon]|jgi:ABC-type Fe3+/spermidine/putrescine transport system ATPase subunit
MPRIQLKHLSKSYGTVRALDDLSLSIQDGEYFCLLGPTGAAKTTLLYTIAGIRQPDQGEIFFEEENVTDLLPEHRRVGFVWESHNLFPHMTVMENTIYGRRVKGKDLKEAREVAQGILDMVLLRGRDSAKPSELSGGMRQRLGIARALAAEPKILLMDEPFGALDAKIRMELRIEIRNLVKELGLTCVHATHDTEEALMTADRVAVMNMGKCVQLGAPETIYRQPESQFVAQFVSESNNLNITVDSVEEEFVSCKLADAIVRAQGQDMSEGDQGIFIIKSENIHLQKANHNSKEGLIGTIERIKFIGEFYRYNISLSDGQRVVCRILPGKAEKFDLKETVAIAFRPESAFVYPKQDQQKK